MKSEWKIAIGIAMVIGVVTMLLIRQSLVPTPIPKDEGVYAAPDFPHWSPADWINSKPLKMADLRGKVVLLDVWTFNCPSCMQSFPWLHSAENRFAPQGLQVIGIHTAQTKEERNRDRIAEKMQEFDLNHPVMVDNNYRYFGALGVNFWPTYILIGKKGNIRKRFGGVMIEGSPKAQEFEKAIQQLLAEPA